MRANEPVFAREFPWPSFSHFFLASANSPAPFLTALDKDRGRREWHRADWRDLVWTTVSGLEAIGIRKGDTVAVLAGNSPQALAVAYASWMMGARYLPLNAQEPGQRHAYILDDAAARVVAYSPTHRTAAGILGRTTGLDTISLDKLTDLPRAAATPRPRFDTTLEDAALLIYTSGTTGDPKGVELTAGNLLTDCDALHSALSWPADTRVLTVLPIHHVNGLVISSLLPWYSGHTTVLTERFSSADFWRDIEDERATVCSVVPSILEFLLDDTEGLAPDHFSQILCGAGPLMPETVRRFEARFGVPVRHLYGLSETTAVATLMPLLSPSERDRWYQRHAFPSIGPAVPHVAVEIHDPDGNTCSSGDRGEIVIRGGTVMTGYANREEDTSHAFRDGWFHSGDEGFWIPAEDGTPYFFITARLKELIIRGGVNLSPLEIDRVLNAHPAVRFALAVPFESRYYGEEVAAYVVAHTDVAPEEILAHCEAHLDHAMTPKVVIFGHDVPYTATGKPKRTSLANDLREHLAPYRDVQFRRRPIGSSSAGTESRVSGWQGA